MPTPAPAWPELLRVLSAVAAGGAPGPGDHDAVATLVDRGLLDRSERAVHLTTLGVIVLDEEHGC